MASGKKRLVALVATSVIAGLLALGGSAGAVTPGTVAANPSKVQLVGAAGAGGFAIELRGWPANAFVDITAPALDAACPSGNIPATVGVNANGAANHGVETGPPCVAGTYTITATQFGNPSKSVSTTVQINAPVPGAAKGILVQPASQTLGGPAGNVEFNVAGTGWAPATPVTVAFAPNTCGLTLVKGTTVTDGNGAFSAVYESTAPCSPHVENVEATQTVGGTTFTNTATFTITAQGSGGGTPPGGGTNVAPSFTTCPSGGVSAPVTTIFGFDIRPATEVSVAASGTPAPTLSKTGGGIGTLTDNGGGSGTVSFSPTALDFLLGIASGYSQTVTATNKAGSSDCTFAVDVSLT